MSPADQIVNGYFAQQKTQGQTQPATGNNLTPADIVVNGFFAQRTNSQPDPLDDTAYNTGTKDQGDQSYDNYCEAFAEQLMYGHQGMFPTAAAAWNNYAQNGEAYQNASNAPAGALVYFAPDQSNGGEGHVGVSDGQGNFVSATSQGVKSMSIAGWEKQTGQTALGYVLPQSQSQQPTQQPAPQPSAGGQQ